MTLQDKLRALPDKPGCYLFRDKRGKIIYVGKALSLRKRVQSYFRHSTLRKAPPKLRGLIHHVADLDTQTVRDEAAALLLEGNLIKQYRPRYNILLRDDKTYPSLKAERGEELPRIQFTRIQRDDGADYYGPFPSDTVVRTVQDFVQRHFHLRKCRPLLPDATTHKHCHADILRTCSAPCIGRITPADYRRNFDEACAFLRGERPAILHQLQEAMQEAAQTQHYEKAAALRDTLAALHQLIKRRANSPQQAPLPAQDAQAGLLQLQTLLNLPAPPRTIECYDISTLFGTHTVASQVTAIDGLPDRRRYKRYRIKTIQGIDDPRSMAEVLTRRLRPNPDGTPIALPDLIVADGGITQLRAVRKVLRELNLVHIPTIGLAERHEEIVTDDGNPALLLERDAPALKILIRLRDEAHRFAITYNRALRQRTIRESILDDIPGIGPARKRELLTHYGSLKRLAAAPLEDLQQRPGITPALAAHIHRKLNPDT